MTMSYRNKLDKVGPRKLLASDGGGIAGIITIEVLAPIGDAISAHRINIPTRLSVCSRVALGERTGARDLRTPTRLEFGPRV
jgi:hypothetical protein